MIQHKIRWGITPLKQKMIFGGENTLPMVLA
jgi:hypothetical protein